MELHLSNETILETIGRTLERLRVEAQLPDSEVVSRGGIKRDTWYNLKAGKNVTLVNLVRALRGLGRLDLLDPLLAQADEVRPMDLVKEKRSALPRRIRTRKPHASGPFTWGDEQ